MVEVKNLTKYYGSKAAVKNLSFTVKEGEILGFLGPNGAGKSTTMNIICGYLPSTSGTVTIDGYEISDEPVKAKQLIGFLPEIPPVYPDMKVKEYLKFCAGIKKVPSSQIKEQVAAAMERLKITDVAGRLIKNLSKGYRQRVGFAQALLGNPKFLILDEPTVGLDPTQVLEVRELIKDLKKDHSVIFSSHILSEVQAVSDRVIIINKGEMITEDTIENLEESMQTAPVVEITAEGDTQKVQSLLASVDGVERVFDSDFVRTGCYSYKVEMKDEEVKSSILQKLLAENINVMSVNDVKLNLEEVFVKLVNRPKEKTDPLKKMLEEMEDVSGEEKPSSSDEKTETKEKENE